MRNSDFGMCVEAELSAVLSYRRLRVDLRVAPLTSNPHSAIRNPQS